MLLVLGGLLRFGGLPPTRTNLLSLRPWSTQKESSGPKTVFGEEETRGATDGVHRHRWGVEREAARGQI